MRVPSRVCSLISFSRLGRVDIYQSIPYVGIVEVVLEIRLIMQSDNQSNHCMVRPVI